MSSIPAPRRRTVLSGLLAAAAVPAVTACSGGITSLKGGGSGGSGAADSGAGLVIGTANFTENQILGHLYAEALRGSGVKATVKPSLGSREVVVPALEGGDIDLLPEYQGNLLLHFDKKAKETEAGELQNALAAELPASLEALPYAAAEDKDVFAVTRETAEKHGLKSYADLRKTDGELVFGGPAEDKTRVVGLVGFRERYDVTFKEFKALDASGPLVKGALKKGDVDIANLFSTDADIRENDWVVLSDPLHMVPAQHVVPVVRSAVADAPVRKALARLGTALTTSELSKLNRMVDVDREDPDDVAAEWAAEHGLTEN
ncbi:ABC transporter substrate-binding protein [Streptomyces abyssalis]|uniref:ABC transporter substrate-binding protein n=1 Tax=Streptomyces abyssalis TaxID=933944 RepID=A0A1E7JMA4_9ACTN|nr:ABC transporter substrate-binding protein [Streptomyces abyssalis]OEU87101.1 ABC transporter substrate-binding protein [Streptomyces abyssalis]OEU89010.1 ABC transporter substrate-binding protein [Streptomyces abyssalis]OEV28724.1 ABC transporter substrate-binding protein [Streptomyces nanshensis]